MRSVGDDCEIAGQITGGDTERVVAGAGTALWVSGDAGATWAAAAGPGAAHARASAGAGHGPARGARPWVPGCPPAPERARKHSPYTRGRYPSPCPRIHVFLTHSSFKHTENPLSAGHLRGQLFHGVQRQRGPPAGQGRGGGVGWGRQPAAPPLKCAPPEPQPRPQPCPDPRPRPPQPNFELIRHDVVEKILLEVDQIYHLACPASPVHYKSVVGRARPVCHPLLAQPRAIALSHSPPGLPFRPPLAAPACAPRPRPATPAPRRPAGTTRSRPSRRRSWAP